MTELEARFVQQIRSATALFAARAEGLVNHINGMSDEELLDSVVPARTKPSPSIDVDSWLTGPLRAIEHALSAIALYKTIRWRRQEGKDE